MKLYLPRLSQRALVLLLAAVLITTCGDEKGTGPNGTTSDFAEMSESLQVAAGLSLTANAQLFASAEAMLPRIGGVLSATNSKSSAATGPCLPDGVGGKVYSLDGDQYVGVVNPTVAFSTARFILYRLTIAGLPDLDHVIGHIDVTCFDIVGPITEVQLALGSTVVVSTTLSKVIGQVTGVFRDSSTIHAIPFEGLFSSNDRLGLTFEIPDQFALNYGYQIPVTDAGIVVTTVTDPEGSVEGALAIQFSVDSAGEVTSGYADLRTDSGLFVVSCISGGTPGNPTFNTPAPACFPNSQSRALATSPADREQISNSYRTVYALWLRAASLVEICRSLAPTTQ